MKYWRGPIYLVSKKSTANCMFSHCSSAFLASNSLKPMPTSILRSSPFTAAAVKKRSVTLRLGRKSPIWKNHQSLRAVSTIIIRRMMKISVSWISEISPKLACSHHYHHQTHDDNLGDHISVRYSQCTFSYLNIHSEGKYHRLKMSWA